jgi:ribosomal protein S18 acetylase RimI-like enzyme
VRIVNGLDAAALPDARALVFEYMSATLAESGRPAVTDIASLPPVLRRECEDLPGCYAPPGALLVGYLGREPAGCVGLADAGEPGTGEVKRLYVRPARRGLGLAGQLLARAHEVARQQEFRRLVMDVMVSRGQVVTWYQRLGYTERDPFGLPSPVPMVYLQKLL